MRALRSTSSELDLLPLCPQLIPYKNALMQVLRGPLQVKGC